MWEEEAKKHRIFLAYEFLKHEKVKVYEEYLIYDTVAMIGAVGGTLGMFIGFSFRNAFSNLLVYCRKLIPN